MAEEQEKKKKPRATLIKHKKDTSSPPSENKEEKSEKKKVVVVKKRQKKKSKIVVKKEAETESSREAPVKEKKTEAVKKESQAPSKAPESKKTDTTKTRKPLKPVETPVVKKRYEKKTQKPAAKPPTRGTEEMQEAKRPKGAAGRVGGKPVNRAPRKPERSYTEKKPAFMDQPPKSDMPSPDKKPSGKKFYKSKKKDYYQKKKEKDKQKEKVLQELKKKQPPKRTNPVPKEIDIMEVVTVSELARKMNLKASDLIGKLMGMGMMVTINQQIDADTATVLAEEYGCKVNIVSLYDETIIETEEDKAEDLSPRPPIITVMGHVDHGKTKLLDAIRSSNVVADEYGGITQHIGAYMVNHSQGKLTFLDTPGHEAFTLMRARGANITDIVVLVVAADDGVMPQTIEAISHAKEAEVPIIVAINKIDLPSANPDRIKQQLSEYDLIPEAWGGSTLFVELSALKNQGIDTLLDTIFLQFEMMELTANHDCKAEGKIIESRIDHGRGIVASVLIERGTLRVGDTFVAGVYPGRVRAMFNDRGEKENQAGPSTPVEILGFTGIPEAGDPFQVTESEKLARQVGDKRQELKKVEEARNVKKITLDNLYDSIQEGEIQELKVIIKGDVHGSVEALQNALERLSTKEIRLNVIQASAGAVHESDVMLAATSNAIIIGFHVRPTPSAQNLAEQEKVEIRKYNVIYDVVDDIKAAMEGLLAPELREETIGNVEVRDTFKVPKIGLIAGSYVESGKVRRGSNVHIIRDGVQIYSGKVNSLKRFKDDVREVDSGYECGIGIENYNDIKVGDRFEVYEIREIAKKLEE